MHTVRTLSFPPNYSDNKKKGVTKDMKFCVVQKKKAFLQSYRLKVRELEKEFRAKLAKISCKNRVEKKLTSRNARES